jgi:catechol 2,3-dioxygenase-like lactoylglutathione lyase family enzyme
MTRWFYTDPLAAAYMSKHFGMRLTDRTNDEEAFPACDLCREPDLRSERYYVHPDSLHLLEPCDGDVVRWRISDGRGGWIPEAGSFGFYEGTGSIETIIQRDGKPFFWPECEAD